MLCGDFVDNLGWTNCRTFGRPHSSRAWPWRCSKFGTHVDVMIRWYALTIRHSWTCIRYRYRRTHSVFGSIVEKIGRLEGHHCYFLYYWVGFGFAISHLDICENDETRCWTLEFRIYWICVQLVILFLAPSRLHFIGVSGKFTNHHVERWGSSTA